MKQKFMLIVSLALAVQLSSFGQDKTGKEKFRYPIVVEEAIKSVTVSDNIDVIFVPLTESEIETVKVPSQLISKLKVSMVNGTLYLSTKKKLDPEDRLLVYITLNDLTELTLKGNAFATSWGVLRSDYLMIDISKEAKLALRSKGKVDVTTPGKYQLSKEKDYSSISTY